MGRVFEAKSNRTIIRRLEEFFAGLEHVCGSADYDRRHDEFCRWFTENVRVSEPGRKKEGKKSTSNDRPSSYGQAAKVLDIAAKVYVSYCSMPSPERASLLMPMLHAGLDNKMIRRLIRAFPDAGIKSQKLGDVDQHKYEGLQALVKREISNSNSQILPVQYDDVIFRRENRPEA
jgi:hypothetical protein